jgi:hypothetical protein
VFGPDPIEAVKGLGAAALQVVELDPTTQLASAAVGENELQTQDSTA